MKDITLLVVDAQKDFCTPNGSLYVQGANNDMNRLASFIKTHKSSISWIVSSLDTHHYYQIFHSCYWKDSEGNPPRPYTTISLTDVETKKYLPVDNTVLEQTKDYLKRLQITSRYELIIWPYHCLVATEGSCLHPAISDAFADYEKTTYRNVDYYLKGEVPESEHYSIFKAEVPIAGKPRTDLNLKLLNKFSDKTNIVVAGEAFDYCVYSSLIDLLNYVDGKNITILKDATSAIDPILADKCMHILESNGVSFVDCDDFTL